MTDGITASAMPTGDAPAPEPPRCQNCGEPLLGPHCYRCGQPVNGLVRHFSSIMGDALDSVLNIDARIFRTLWPLFAKPGYLTLEYFAGHRVRYVSPVRLFVFLSIVTFFVARLALSVGDGKVNFGGGDDDIRSATTVAQVEQARDQAIKGLEAARASIPASAHGATAGIDAGIRRIRSESEARIKELQDAKAAGKPVPDAAGEEPHFQFNGRDWDPVANPLRVSWLPGFANGWINAQVGRGKQNVARLQKDPGLFKDAVLGALPSTLFVLMPIFALMLKTAYLFKRRLYMEHLIVALHSHAFLCLALLPVFGLGALRDAFPSIPGIGLLEAALFVWMPLYLLLMQKRVYGQGWTMTLLKYAALGFCYFVLLVMGVTVTMVASIVWM